MDSDIQERAAAEVLDSLEDDWVDAAEVYSIVREEGVSAPEDIRDVAIAVVVALINEGRVIPGDIRSTGHVAWSGTREEWIERVRSAWVGQPSPWPSLGDLFWLADAEQSGTTIHPAGQGH